MSTGGELELIYIFWTDVGLPYGPSYLRDGWIELTRIEITFFFKMKFFF